MCSVNHIREGGEPLTVVAKPLSRLTCPDHAAMGHAGRCFGVPEMQLSQPHIWASVLAVQILGRSKCSRRQSFVFILLWFFGPFLKV